MKYLALLLALYAAQDKPFDFAQGRPVFRGGVELVSVDFLAVGKDGAPVEGLRKENLTLKVNGTERQIQTLQFVRAVRSATASKSILPDASARPVLGRRFIIVINDGSLSASDLRPATDAAIDFVRQLGPDDEIGVVTLPQGRIESGFAKDRAETIRALERVRGFEPTRAPSRGGPAGGMSAENRLPPSSTSDIKPGQARIAGTGCPVLKNLRVFLSGLKLDTIASVVFVSSELPSTTSAECRIPFEDVVREATERRVRIFTIRPNSAPLASDTSSGLEAMARFTGGHYFDLSGGAGRAFGEINRSTSGYYLLGFEPDSKERNGKFHSIAVTSSDPAVEIRARSSFKIPK